MVLDIVGKEVAEGLNEPDSIEALQQQNDEEFDIFDAPPTKKPIRKRRISVSIFIKNLYFFQEPISQIEQAKIRALDAQARASNSQANLFNAQARLTTLQADALEKRLREDQEPTSNQIDLYEKFMF